MDELDQKIKELEDIPLYDVKGGRQRTSKENEMLYQLRFKRDALKRSE